MNSSIGKVLAGVIYISALSLLILGGIAFFFPPAYEKGVWAAIEAFKDVLLVAVGVKGGAWFSSKAEAQPEPKPSESPLP